MARPQPLDYAPYCPRTRGRKIRRAASWLLALFLLATAGYFFAPPAYRRARILYWQQRCMTHESSVGKRVVEVRFDAAFRPELQKIDTCHESGSLYEALGPHEDWMERYLDPWNGSLFVHARKSAAGERLVVVNLDAGTQTGGIGAPRALTEFRVMVLQLGTLTQDPRKLRGSGYYELLRERFLERANPTLAPGQTLHVYAGQLDPTDAAAFTIAYDIDGIRHEMRFRLIPTGDAVELVSITPPL